MRPPLRKLYSSCGGKGRPTAAVNYNAGGHERAGELNAAALHRRINGTRQLSAVRQPACKITIRHNTQPITAASNVAPSKQCPMLFHVTSGGHNTPAGSLKWSPALTPGSLFFRHWRSFQGHSTKSLAEVTTLQGLPNPLVLCQSSIAVSGLHRVALGHSDAQPHTSKC